MAPGHGSLLPGLGRQGPSASRSAWRGAPQVLLLLLALCAIAPCNTSSSALTNKIANGCYAAGGVCKAKEACGPQATHLTDKVCRVNHLACCLYKASGAKLTLPKYKEDNSKQGYINGPQQRTHQKRILQENSNSKRIIHPFKNIEKETTYQNNNIVRKESSNIGGVGAAQFPQKIIKPKSSSQTGVGAAQNPQKRIIPKSPSQSGVSAAQNPQKRIIPKTPSQSGVGASQNPQKRIIPRIPSQTGVGVAPYSRIASTRQENVCAKKRRKKCKKVNGTCFTKKEGCPEAEVEVKDGCNSSKTCKCCRKCKVKKKCTRAKGYCTNEKTGCPKDYKVKKHCLTKGCVCCVPKPEKPPKEPPVGCNQEKCEAANGWCVKFADECPTLYNFGINYVLCEGSNCKCCLGPPISLTTELIEPTDIRDKDCPKSPAGVSQTCPTCGIIKSPNITKPITDLARVTGSQALDFPHKYPWLVWLEHDNLLRGGGAIISSQFVLTAAQSVYKVCNLLSPQAVKVIIADHNRNSQDDDVAQTCTVKSEQLIPFPDYVPCSSKMHDNDIALIKLAAPLNVITESSILRPICLPTASEVGKSYVGAVTVIAGWGLTNINSDNFPDVPHEAEIQILSSSECQRFWYWEEGIMLCGGGTSKPSDACVGDSGSPLIMQLNPGVYSVIGIVSGGDPNCNGPGVYTRVDRHLDWIRNTADLLETCPVVP